MYSRRLRGTSALLILTLPVFVSTYIFPPQLVVNTICPDYLSNVRVVLSTTDT